MADSVMKRKQKRHYVEDQMIQVEESYHHEFKGHSSICEEEIPKSAILDDNRRSRAPVSRAINAFLNSGAGGTVYMGVLDSGVVKGFHMTQYTKDHIRINIDDLLMERYVPPVGPHRYKVKFVPVVEQGNTDEQLEAILKYDSKSAVDFETRKKKHTLRAVGYCWCHNDCKSQLQHGRLPSSYVIEVIILPWNPNDPRNDISAIGALRAHPVHQDETGCCWFRRQAGLTQYKYEEIASLAKETVAAHYEPQLQSLQAEMEELLCRCK